MWGVDRSDARGTEIVVGRTRAVPIVRTWSVGGRWTGWSAGVAYAAPVLEVSDAAGTREVRIPDIELWTRLGAAALVALAILGGRRWATTR